MSDSAYKDLLVNVGLPARFAAVLADSDSQTEQGWLQHEPNALSKLFVRPTTSLSQAVITSL